MTVDGWPTPIDAGNVVDVTLRDAYAAYPEDTASRVDFLGDVAKAAVDQATSGTLGKPAADRQGARRRRARRATSPSPSRGPRSSELAEQLGVAQQHGPGALRRVRGDDVERRRQQDRLLPEARRRLPSDAPTRPTTRRRERTADVTVALDNTAPDTGLPQIVIGPFDQRFIAGQNRSFISLYSPPAVHPGHVGRRAGRRSLPDASAAATSTPFIENVFSKQTKAMAVKLDGNVKLHGGWYALDVRHQPTLNPDRLHVSVDVPEGWKIDRAPGMERPFARRATVVDGLSTRPRGSACTSCATSERGTCGTGSRPEREATATSPGCSSCAAPTNAGHHWPRRCSQTG